MDFTESDYLKLLEESYPKPLLKAVTLAVVDGYRATPAAVKKAMDIPDRHDAFGVIRRGKINEQLRGVCDHHSLAYRDESNSNGSTRFLSMFSGRVRLAAHLVGSPRCMVRPANIRRLWAMHNRDGRWRSLFPNTETPAPPEAKFVAFVIHGPRSRHRDQPAFVDLVIPDRDFTKYTCHLDLFKLFPQIAMSIVSQDVQRKQPKPRRRRETGSA